MEVKAGYKRTEAGVIPEDWRLSSMGEEAELLTGFPFPSSGFTKSGVRLLRGSNVKRGVVDWSSDITQYWATISAKIRTYEMRAGDLAIAMDGALVGRSFATIDASDLPALLVQRVARLRSKKTVQGLLRAWVASDFFVRHVDLVKTHTAIPHISPKDIREFAVVVPSAMAEQEAIAEALSDVDALLAGLDRLIAKKRDLKQAAMQQLLTGQTRLPDFQGEWEIKPLGELVKIQKGQPVTAKTLVPGSVPVIAGGKQPAYFHAVANRRGRTITISASGASAGYVAIHDGPIYASDCSTIGEADGYSLDFVYYQLVLKQELIFKAQTGGAQPHIHAKDLNPIPIFVPTVGEQVAIAEMLRASDAELTALEARRDKTRALKQGMMQELLTGRTRLI